MAKPLRDVLGFGGAAAGKTFESFQPETQRVAYEKAKSFLDDPRTLIFEGPNGIGKTHLALAIGNALIERDGLNLAPVCFITFQDALRQLRKTYQDGYEGIGEECYLAKWRGIPVLILDEVGLRGLEQAPSEFTRRIGYDIVDGRYRAGHRPMIITTNKKPAQLGDWITESAVDRLFEMGEFVSMEGRSWRRTPR